MRGSVVPLICLFVFVGAASCGTIEAARDAGEKAAGGGEAGAPEPGGGRTGGDQARTVAGKTPEATGAGPEGTTRAGAQTAAGETGGGPVLDDKWYRDSDGNYVPDFVEAANGDDPNRDDCAPEKCPGGAEGVGVEFLTQRRNALLVLDSSGSMAAGDGTGRTKMEAAKEALLRYSGPSSVLYETGFAVFGHTGDATEAGREESCAEAAEILSPLGGVDPATFGETLDGFGPTGWTPIEGALREAGEAFEGEEGQENRVIVVSDGAETCGGDPVAAAEELHRSGIEVTVDVVGFGVPNDESGQLRDIATAGGGEYFDAATGVDLDRYFEEQSRALDQTWDAFACELRNGFHDQLCDQTQCNDATVFVIPEEQRKYEYGSPEYEALQDISDRITAGFEERQEARDEANARATELYERYLDLQEEYRRAFDAAYGAPV